MIKALGVHTDSATSSVVMIRKQRVSISSHRVRHIKWCALKAVPNRAEQVAWARGGKANG